MVNKKSYAIGKFYINKEEADLESLKYFDTINCAMHYYYKQLLEKGPETDSYSKLAIFTIINNRIVDANYINSVYIDNLDIGPVGPYKDRATIEY